MVMRLRLTALGCALTGTITLLALPPATALAVNTVPTKSTPQAVSAPRAHHSASHTRYAYLRVASRLTGYYKTGKTSSGIVYHFFHGRGTLTLYATVYPNKHGDCLEPETQQYDAGAGWHVDTKWGCDTLDGASHDTAPFSLAQAVGARYRIRDDYFRSSRDTVSTRKQGPWLYFIVTE
jgi:hypothetical protein